MGETTRSRWREFPPPALVGCNATGVPLLQVSPSIAKRNEAMQNFCDSPCCVLDEELHIGIGRVFEERRRTADCALWDKVFLLKAENVHRHLASYEVDSCFDA